MLRLSAASLRIWGSPISATAAAFVAYFIVAAFVRPLHLGQSSYPYFAYLAEAFLHGRLGLVSMPPSTGDLVWYQGSYYLYWPPFPAIIYMPFVAVFGPGVSDAPINLLVGAANVGLVSMLLRKLDRQKIALLAPEKRAWITAFFAFGTVHAALVPNANVWTQAQVMGFALIASATLLTLRIGNSHAVLVAGVLAGCAFLTRNPSIFALLWPALYRIRMELRFGRQAAIATAAIGLIPVLVAVAALGLYNAARFGNPADVGLDYHLMEVSFKSEYDRYGPFSLHYAPTNLYYYFVAFPYLAFFSADPSRYFWMGGSLFLMSPLFVFALAGFVRSWNTHGRTLLLSCILGLAPALLLMGTGYLQFGPRYTLDITVPLLVATAIGVGRVPTSLVGRLTLFSMAIYIPGAIMYALTVHV